MNDLLKKLKWGVRLTQYDGSHPIASRIQYNDCKQDKTLINFQESKWQVSYCSKEVEENKDAVDLSINFKLVEGSLPQGNVTLELVFDDWSVNHSVFMPGAVYNGNRYKVSKQAYPPMLTKEDQIGVNIPITITDVPRLNIGSGESKIQLRTGDMATPAIGFYGPETNKGFIMLTTQKTVLGESGISIEENNDRTQAIINLSVPAVRHNYKYTMCETKDKSDDRGYDFNVNDEVTLKCRLYTFDCYKTTELFHYFLAIRKDLSGKVEFDHQVPFSKAWEIQEHKYNRDNWVEPEGFYKISTSTAPGCIGAEWQTGWVGGAMNSFPLLMVGNELSKERAYRNLEFVFRKIQAPSGFLYGSYYQGKLYGDSFKCEGDINQVLLRKNSDALYFLIKQLMLMDKMKKLMIPDYWKEGLRKLSNAFVRLWKKYGQFGQFIDIEKEEIVIGGSSSAGITSAGLALAGQYLNDDTYIKVAEESALYFYNNFISKGVSNGGPGEICQCPDSESVFGLLESYLVLYEVTGDCKWIPMAEHTANLCATWCISYDYEYPQESAFAKLGMRSAGAVYANAQNKHAGPGICTLSGDSLFKLYRATGNKLYLELIQDTAHNLPQYLSREDRPLKISWGFNNNDYNGDMNSNTGNTETIPSGWMNERVNTCDWEGKENIGGIPGGSCWCEISNMLTYVEIPGIYIQKDTGFVCAIDHVSVEVVENNETQLVLEISNPTKFEAKVKLFIENYDEIAKPIGQNALYGCKELLIEARATKKLIVAKH